MSGVILQPLCANTTTGAARIGISVLWATAAAAPGEIQPGHQEQEMILQHIRASTWPGLLSWALQGCAGSTHPIPNPWHRASTWLPLTQFPTASLLPGALPETPPIPKCPLEVLTPLPAAAAQTAITSNRRSWFPVALALSLATHRLGKWHQYREICPFQQQQLLKISLNWSWNCTLGPTFHSHEVTSAGRAADRSGCVLLLHVPGQAGASPLSAAPRTGLAQHPPGCRKGILQSETRGGSSETWEQRER